MRVLPVHSFTAQAGHQRRQSPDDGASPRYTDCSFLQAEEHHQLSHSQAASRTRFNGSEARALRSSEEPTFADIHISARGWMEHLGTVSTRYLTDRCGHHACERRHRMLRGSTVTYPPDTESMDVASTLRPAEWYADRPLSPALSLHRRGESKNRGGYADRPLPPALRTCANAEGYARRPLPLTPALGNAVVGISGRYPSDILPLGATILVDPPVRGDAVAGINGRYPWDIGHLMWPFWSPRRAGGFFWGGAPGGDALPPQGL